MDIRRNRRVRLHRRPGFGTFGALLVLALLGSGGPLIVASSPQPRPFAGLGRAPGPSVRPYRYDRQGFLIDGPGDASIGRCRHVSDRDWQGPRGRKPRIEFGKARLRGSCQGVAAELHQSAQRQLALTMTALYRVQLRCDPGRQGRVTLRWRILPDGTADDARITRSTLKDRWLEARLLSRLHRLRFHGPEGSTCDVTLPLRFYP